MDGMLRLPRWSARTTLRVAPLAGVLALGAPTAIAALTVPPLPSVVLLVPAPLPPQPGGPASSCLAQPSGAGGWTAITRQQAPVTPVTGSTGGAPLPPAPGSPGGAPLFPAPGYQVIVDPQLPCRMYRARDAQTLERSVDSGRTWTTVFHDAATTPYAGTDPSCGPVPAPCALSSAPFTASSVSVLSGGVPGLVAIGERGNGDGAVISDDAGATWALAGGLAGGTGGVAGHRVRRLLTVRDGDPTHSVFGAAVVEAPPQPDVASGAVPLQTIFTTSDSGVTWQPTDWSQAPFALGSLPPATVDAMAVWPRDPRRVWAVAGGTFYDGTSKAPSGGQSPSLVMGLIARGGVPGGTARQLVAATTVSGLRMYLVGADGRLYYTDDAAAGSTTLPVAALQPVTLPPVTWHAVPLPASVHVVAVAAGFAGQAFAVAADASQPAARGVRFFETGNGFTSFSEVPAPPTGDTTVEASVRTPLLADGGAPPPPEAILQADTRGNFYVGLSGCARLRAGSGCVVAEQSYWRYTLPPPPRASTTTTPPGGPNGSSGQPLPVDNLTEIVDCPLGAAGGTAPLAFDGINLIYPDPSSRQRAPFTDVVDILPAQSCLTTPPRPVTVHFDPADGPYAQCTLTCTQVRIDDLTYDPGRHQLWFTAYGISPSAVAVSSAAQVQTSDGVLFTAPWPPLDRPVTDVVAHVAYLPGHHANGCGGANGINVAYDVNDDSLWTCSLDASGRMIGDHIRARDGADIPDHCAPSEYTQGWYAPGIPGTPGRLYRWNEDDSSIDALSTATCTAVQTLVHRPIVEPTGEDEQFACDPLTFTAIRDWPGPELTVFWLRESAFDQVIAFASSSATCPLPTRTAVVAASVACGQPLAMAATLALQGPGLPLPRQSVDFSIDGVPAGSALTGADGVAHLTVVAAPGAGQYHVTARFSGTSRLLPSAAEVAETVEVGPGCIAAHPVAPAAFVPVAAGTSQLPPLQPPALPAPVPAPGPAPAAQSAAASAVQAQAQAQSQVQSQSAVQAQPGFMVQPVRQRQVATSTVRTVQAAVSSLSAVGRRTQEARLAMVLVSIAALALAGWVPRTVAVRAATRVRPTRVPRRTTGR